MPRQVPAGPGRSRQLLQLCCHLLQASLPAGLLFLTRDLVPCSYPKPHGISHPKPHSIPLHMDLMADHPLSLSALPYFKCLAQNFLCDLIFGPSYDVHFCQFSRIFLLLLATIFSQGDSSQQLPGWASSPCLLLRCCVSFPGHVRSHCTCQSPVHLSSPWAAALSIQEGQGCYLAIVMQSILNAISSTSPLLQPKVWGFFPCFQGASSALHYSISLPNLFYLHFHSSSHKFI